jgi:hypothetical protein
MAKTLLLLSVFAIHATSAYGAVGCCAKIYGDSSVTCAASACPSKNTTSVNGWICRTSVNANGTTATNGAIDCVNFGDQATGGSTYACTGADETAIAATANNGIGCPCTDSWCTTTPAPGAHRSLMATMRARLDEMLELVLPSSEWDAIVPCVLVNGTDTGIQVQLHTHAHTQILPPSLPHSLTHSLPPSPPPSLTHSHTRTIYLSFVSDFVTLHQACYDAPAL